MTLTQFRSVTVDPYRYPFAGTVILSPNTPGDLIVVTSRAGSQPASACLMLSLQGDTSFGLVLRRFYRVYDRVGTFSVLDWLSGYRCLSFAFDFSQVMNAVSSLTGWGCWRGVEPHAQGYDAFGKRPVERFFNRIPAGAVAIAERDRTLVAMPDFYRLRDLEVTDKMDTGIRHSQDGAPDSEPASDLALRSGQSCTSNQEYSGSSPMTWSKDGDAEAAPVDAAWSDLFDNREKLETYSRSRQLLLKPKGTSNISVVSSTLHPPVRQAGVLDSGDYTLRPTLLDANAPYRAFITRTQSDPPSYTPAMNVQNNRVKTILPYYQSLFTKFFSSCRCALEHWSSVARYLKVPDVPLPPTKPTSLGRSTRSNSYPTPFGQGTAEYVMHLAIDHMILCEWVHQSLVSWSIRIDDRRDTVPDRCPDSPEAAAAAAAEYFAAMKKWDEQNVDVAEYIVHVEVPLVHVQHPVNWFIRPHLGYPGELDRNDRPLCEAASRRFACWRNLRD
ncbi:hypothetical protein BS47DRAFT_1399730 [Hydnum rufescens UP504]|uniref:Uncharacterized protein n=1 Tax=Hydnum rufescens UP504 TaxID=1448309 RepID=A0A9P6AJR4_9AGAM|nr:hypothetical protein BS47DRAFT_1399730 [Hydnum rufescens UP504]